jgi:hypothetical protein
VFRSEMDIAALDYLSQWNVLSQCLIKFDIEKG